MPLVLLDDVEPDVLGLAMRARMERLRPSRLRLSCAAP
jgi:hypothetical protein